MKATFKTKEGNSVVIDTDEQKIKDITKEMTEQFGIEPKTYLSPCIS